MRRWPKKYVEITPNGHLLVGWPEASPLFFDALRVWLRLGYGLRREGRTIYSPDGDMILPDLVGAEVRLKSGWDNWSGYYLLSEDDAGDRFLRRSLAREV